MICKTTGENEINMHFLGQEVSNKQWEIQERSTGVTTISQTPGQNHRLPSLSSANSLQV